VSSEYPQLAYANRQRTNVKMRTAVLAMRVHRNLGLGLLEPVYRRCLCHEF
jgi:hypothetical protein